MLRKEGVRVQRHGRHYRCSRRRTPPTWASFPASPLHCRPRFLLVASLTLDPFFFFDRRHSRSHTFSHVGQRSPPPPPIRVRPPTDRSIDRSVFLPLLFLLIACTVAVDTNPTVEGGRRSKSPFPSSLLLHPPFHSPSSVEINLAFPSFPGRLSDRVTGLLCSSLAFGPFPPFVMS